MNTFETSWPEKFVSLLLLFLLLAQFLFFLHVMDVVMFLAAWWWTSPTCFKPDRIKLFQTGVYLHEWQHSSACQEMNSHRAFSCDDFPQRPLPHPKTAVLWTTWSCCGVDFMSRALSKWSFTTISSLTPALSKLSRHLPYTRRNLHFSRIKYYKLYSSTNSLLHLKAPPGSSVPRWSQVPGPRRPGPAFHSQNSPRSMAHVAQFQIRTRRPRQKRSSPHCGEDETRGMAAWLRMVKWGRRKYHAKSSKI